MGVRIINGALDGDSTGYQCLYCSTTMFAFGPLFDADDDVQHFLEWLGEDARLLSEPMLETKKIEWQELPKCEWCENRSTEPLTVFTTFTGRDYAACPECHELYKDDEDAA